MSTPFCFLCICGILVHNEPLRGTVLSLFQRCAHNHCLKRSTWHFWFWQCESSLNRRHILVRRCTRRPEHNLVWWCVYLFVDCRVSEFLSKRWRIHGFSKIEFKMICSKGWVIFDPGRDEVKYLLRNNVGTRFYAASHYDYEGCKIKKGCSSFDAQFIDTFMYAFSV